MNKMEEIRIQKVTLNMGTGGPGENLEKATRLLKNLTGSKPIETSSKKRIPSWGVRPGLRIGCKITLRKQKAETMLKRLFRAKNNQLSQKNFDTNGNFSFGISEYLDIPEAEYDASIGIIGLEVAVTLGRPGFRISSRRIQKRKIPKKITITKEEAIKFISSEYGVEIGERE